MISYTSGRDEIYSVLLEYLRQRPFTGYGVYGEYTLGYAAGAHNAYLQIVFNFGCILGGALLLVYIIVFIKGLMCSKGKFSQNWIIVFGCIVFIRSIFGGSYFNYAVFFLLGICLHSIRYNER